MLLEPAVAASLSRESRDLLPLLTPEELEEYRRLSRRPPRNSFNTFLTECCWTIDKERAGMIRPWPTDANNPDPRGVRSWDALWLDWESLLLGPYPRLLVDKTRRVLASNVVCAFDLWLALGGRDPRWPDLMAEHGGRSVLIQAMKLEGQNGSAEFVSRIAALYQMACERSALADRWPGLPSLRATFQRNEFTNGSLIEALAQGEVRGPGTIFLHLEELGAMTQAKKTISSAIPALSGRGKLCALTTPNAGSYADKIRRGEVKDVE